MYKAIVFDWDETIVDSFDTYFEIHKAVGEKLGLEPVTISRFLKGWSNPWDVLVDTLWPGSDFEAVKKEAFKMFKSVDTKPIKGAVEALDRLSREYSLGLITNSFLKVLEHDSKCLGLDLKIFKIKETADTIVHRKPDSRAFDPVLKFFGFDKKEILYVGDDVIDAKFAKNVGVDFVAVLTGKTSRARFIECGVDRTRIVKSVAELNVFLKVNK